MTTRYTTLLHQGAAAAIAAVARESASAILTPRYTENALLQMGWERSYGAPAAYREGFRSAFCVAWQERVFALEQAACPVCHGERVLGAAAPLPCPECA